MITPKSLALSNCAFAGALGVIMSIKFCNQSNVHHWKKTTTMNCFRFIIWVDMITPKSLALSHCGVSWDLWVIMSSKFCNERNVHLHCREKMLHLKKNWHNNPKVAGIVKLCYCQRRRGHHVDQILYSKQRSPLENNEIAHDSKFNLTW